MKHGLIASLAMNSGVLIMLLTLLAIPRGDAQAIYARDRGRCHLCGKHVRRADASMDHLIPISLGGAHAPWNVALAHLHCNQVRNVHGPAQLLLRIR